MAYHSLVEQALSDINDLDPEEKNKFSNSVSYNLLRNLIAYNLLQNHRQLNQPPSQVQVQFQFKIQVSTAANDEYQALLSEEHEA